MSKRIKMLGIFITPERCIRLTLIFSIIIHLAMFIQFKRKGYTEDQVVLKSQKSNKTLINVVVLDKWEKIKPLKKHKSSAGEIPRLLDKKKKIKIKRKIKKVQVSLSKEALEAKESYITKVLRQIHRRKYYPSIARRMRLEGDVKVKFTLDKTGQVVGTAFLMEGCKYEILNKAGQSTVLRAGPYPAFPKDVAEKKSKMTFVVTVEYSLKY